MAQRIALKENINALPFTNELLAASVGKSTDEFNATPVSDAAVNVVFDALAESKHGQRVESGLFGAPQLSSLAPSAGVDWLQIALRALLERYRAARWSVKGCGPRSARATA